MTQPDCLSVPGIRRPPKMVGAERWGNRWQNEVLPGR